MTDTERIIEAIQGECYRQRHDKHGDNLHLTRAVVNVAAYCRNCGAQYTCPICEHYDDYKTVEAMLND